MTEQEITEKLNQHDEVLRQQAEDIGVLKNASKDAHNILVDDLAERRVVYVEPAGFLLVLGDILAFRLSAAPVESRTCSPESVFS